MNDLAQTIAPKSDQLNADDLIAGPRTIRVTKVSVNVAGEQPVSVHFDGDNGKPFRPCKSMRRVMVALWGADGNAYAGRAMTLYRDDSVQFGGLAVGGIRISHMSHIDAEKTLILTATKKSRKPFTVRRLAEPKPVKPKPEPAQDWSGDETRAILNSKLELKEVPADEFPQKVRGALAGIHDLDTLANWELGMKPIVSDADDWERIIGLIRGKRAALVDGGAA